MGRMVTVPSPPAFLDPLTLIESCYYYAVPKFFGQNHPNTRWLVTMLKNSEEDRIKHKMEITPGAFKGVYYQMMDCPQLYIPEDVAASPMFKRQAVVYLSPLGMAIYLGNTAMVELLLGYTDAYDEPLCDPNEPQYATHLQDNEVGDFHAFPPFLVMMRRSSFGCAQPLRRAGWNPSLPVAMPMRRKFERRALYFRDWLEVALAVLASRPMYPLQVLLREMVKSQDYVPLQMPLEQLLPKEPAKAQPVGLINVDELPPGMPMVGVRSLLDMAEHYDRYLQMRQCARQVAALKQEATAVGLNPEVLMIQAQDFDGGALAGSDQTESSNVRRGGNNNSTSCCCPGQEQENASISSAPAASRHVMLNVNMSASKKKKGDENPPFASEGCRLLHYALTRDPKGKSMQICMESFCVLLRRGFYLLATAPDPKSPQARDVRNTAILMLNLVQREQDKVDRIVDKIKSGVKKFAHLEEHKQLENRKTACIQYMSKLVGVLTKLLLQSRILVHFVQAEFPPYSPVDTNFPINPYLAQKFQEIKFGVIREFNACKEAWIYLDKEMLETVSGIMEMQLHFKVGKIPTIPPKGAKKNKNKSNMSNTNSCFVSYTRVQRRQRPTAASIASRAAEAAAAAASSTTSVTGSSVAFTAADADGDVANSEAALAMDSSGHEGTCTADTCDLPDLPDLSDLGVGDDEADAAALSRAASRAGDASLTRASSSGAAAAGSTTAASPDNMEQMLASLCREVNSLFRPLEASVGDGDDDDEDYGAGAAAATGSATVTGNEAAAASAAAAAGGHQEHSTIEPELLATTPMPTPEPSPAVDNARWLGAQQQLLLPPPPPPPPPKRSGVRRFWGRLSTKETVEVAAPAVKHVAKPR